MRIVCITLGLLVMSFSAAVGGDFVNFAPRGQSPFLLSKGLLLGGSYANSNRDGNADTEGNDGYEVVDWYVGERARQVIVPKGRYVEVTYSGEYEKAETVEGFVREMDKTELTIYQGGLRRRIPVDRIDILMVSDNATQHQLARRVIGKGNYIPDTREWRVSKKLVFGGLTGVGIGYLMLKVSEEDCTFAPRGSWCGLGTAALGGIGYFVGVGFGVSMADPYDRIGYTMVGSLLGTILGLGMKSVSLFYISPVIGAIIMSELSRKSPEVKVRRFSVGFAPDREGNLSAVATLRF